MKNGLGKSDMQLTRQLLSNPEPTFSPSVRKNIGLKSAQIITKNYLGVYTQFGTA